MNGVLNAALNGPELNRKHEHWKTRTLDFVRTIILHRVRTFATSAWMAGTVDAYGLEGDAWKQDYGADEISLAGEAGIGPSGKREHHTPNPVGGVFVHRASHRRDNRLRTSRVASARPRCTAFKAAHICSRCMQLRILVEI